MVQSGLMKWQIALLEFVSLDSRTKKKLMVIFFFYFSAADTNAMVCSSVDGEHFFTESVKQLSILQGVHDEMVVLSQVKVTNIYRHEIVDTRA